jgi:hypothetical protein
VHSVVLSARAAGVTRATTTAVSVLALSVWPRAAAAHGGLFRADELRVDPTDADHLLVRSDVWGLIETHDAGRTWRWTCAAAAFGSDVTVLREPLAILPGGRVVMGSTRHGIVRSKGSLCDFEVVSFFEPPNCEPLRCSPYDVVQEAPGSSAVIALTTGGVRAGEFVGALWRSPDGGNTWTDVNATLPTSVFPVSVTVAPSDASILYVGSSDAAVAPTLFLHSSVDSGRTFEQTTVPVTMGANDPGARVRFYGVHPDDPRTVFLWIDADPLLPNGMAPDRLFVSFDGGATVTLGFQAKNDLPGFALSKDGATVFVGGTNDGLWSAALGDLRAGTPDAFKLVNSGNTWGLAVTDRGLLAGREEYAAEAGTERMTLGLSKDEGMTFEPAMVICDVLPAECPKGTRSGDLCPGLYYGDNNFQFDQQLGRCASDPKPTTDAGTKPAAPMPPKSVGCACQLTTEGNGTGASAIGLMIPALARLRRTLEGRGARKRHKSRRTS